MDSFNVCPVARAVDLLRMLGMGHGEPSSYLAHCGATFRQHLQLLEEQASIARQDSQVGSALCEVVEHDLAPSRQDPTLMDCLEFVNVALWPAASCWQSSAWQ